MFLLSMEFFFFFMTMQATGSWDKTIRIWNPKTGKCIHVCEGHFGWVQAIAFSPDGTYLASACDDQTVRIWDVVDGSCCRILEVSYFKPSKVSYHICKYTNEKISTKSQMC